MELERINGQFINILYSIIRLFIFFSIKAFHQNTYWFAQGTKEKKTQTLEKKKSPETPPPEVKVQPKKRRWLKVILLAY